MRVVSAGWVQGPDEGVELEGCWQWAFRGMMSDDEGQTWSRKLNLVLLSQKCQLFDLGNNILVLALLRDWEGK